MAKWYEDSGFQSDIVLSTRIRLARNFKGIPFPGKISPEDAARVVDITEKALEGTNLDFSRVDIPPASKTEKDKLIEKRFISPNLATQKKSSAVFISRDESISVMVNEEDHIRMQTIFAGFECQKAYEVISGLDECISEKTDYAVHQKYGYLTSCLTNVGTGMRISCMMHLPAICKANMADSLFAALAKLGVTVRGMYGEGSKASGYIFQISNQTTLGISETEIVDRLNSVVNELIAKERSLRKTIYKQDEAAMEDKIMRSLGILKTARLLSGKEMLELFSNIRQGISLGLVEDVEPKTLNYLMVETSAAHLSDRASDARERDILRAKIVRERMV